MRIVLVALVAALAGAGASLFFDPVIATRLASTEPGQQLLGAVLKSQAPPPPEGVIVAERGDIVPVMNLPDVNGVATRLPDAWLGKPRLVNLWATWCAPCVAEMPTLDALAAQKAGKLTVVAVAQDLQGAAVVDPWFQKAGLKALQPYVDPENGLLDAANSALPTSIYYDAEGREIWRVIGAIDWQGAEARALLAEAN